MSDQVPKRRLYLQKNGNKTISCEVTYYKKLQIEIYFLTNQMFCLRIFDKSYSEISTFHLSGALA